MACPAVNYESVCRDQMFGRIVTSLQRLPESLRDVFARAHYSGQSLHEIALEMDVPPENAAAMLRDAEHLFYKYLKA